MIVLASQVTPLGKQTLYQDFFHYYVRLENRTNDTVVEIPAEAAARWEKALRADRDPAGVRPKP